MAADEAARGKLRDLSPVCLRSATSPAPYPTNLLRQEPPTSSFALTSVLGETNQMDEWIEAGDLLASEAAIGDDVDLRGLGRRRKGVEEVDSALGAELDGRTCLSVDTLSRPGET